MDRAKEHALDAHELLAAVHARQDELEGLDTNERLQLTAAGSWSKINADLAFTVELATAHALTAIALCLEDRFLGG